MIRMIDSIATAAKQLAELLTYSSYEERNPAGAESNLSSGFLSAPRIQLRRERFHHFAPSSPPWKTLVVDASLKSIIDCGAFVVVLIKVAFEIWQLGSRRVKEEIETYVEVFRSLETARQRMAALEFELANKATRHLSEGDVALLDRPLCLRPHSAPRLKQSLENLASSLTSRQVGFLGVCKSSRLGVESGAPLIGYLLHHASKMDIDRCWFYYPLAETTTPSTLRIGQPCVAALNVQEEFAFRIDLGPNTTQVDYAERILGSAAALGDRFAYGYPYPLRSVHEACAISHTEVDICRQQLLEAASRKGIYPNLRYALKATSFREEVLLS